MLSVVTTVRNRNRMLQAMLAGLGRQPPGIPFEVVVVDADSEVNPAVVIRDRPELNITIESAPIGPGGAFPYAEARNIGAAAAQGDTLLFLDADTIPAPGAINAYASALASTDAMFTGEVLYLPPTTTGAYPVLESDLRRLSRSHPARPQPPAIGVELGADPNLLWSVALALRASTFERVGGFDTRYEGYGAEDTDLTWAAHCMGIPAGLVGAATVFHQHHDSHEPPLHQVVALVRNAEHFHRKWRRWPMQGWLSQMTAMGLIDWSPSSDRIVIRRSPTAQEIADSYCDRAAPFRCET